MEIQTGITQQDVLQDVEKIYRDGIAAYRGAFSTHWTHRLRHDMMEAFWEGLQRPGGAVGRGPRRWYVEVHPQTISGFTEIVTHPWFLLMSESLLGPKFEIVEIGLDVPFEGAKYQPWHRDFPSPEETYKGKKITSLAFNMTGVDVTPEMGPFEVALGTQWEDGRNWKHQMFPPAEMALKYANKAIRTFPKMGDISCRSALTIHRGTEHNSMIPRPVLVIGVDAPGAGHAALHDMQVTSEFYESLPAVVKQHLVCRIVDQLQPITQKHGIEGLVMAANKDY